MDENAIRKTIEGRIRELRSEAAQLEGVARKLGGGSGRPSKGRAKAPARKARAKRSKAARPSAVTTDMLLGAFNGNGGALTSAQLRERLGLSKKSVSDFVLRKQLGDAVEAGSLKREGVARSTRYTLAA